MKTKEAALTDTNQARYMHYMVHTRQDFSAVRVLSPGQLVYCCLAVCNCQAIDNYEIFYQTLSFNN